MSESFTKKEYLKRESRKDNNNKGKNLEDMIVYVDINGHFTSVPTHLQNRDADLAKAKRIRELVTHEKEDFAGIITFLSEKGFGFITEDGTGENIFFHVGQANQIVEKHTKVSYKKEMTIKGIQATDIRK